MAGLGTFAACSPGSVARLATRFIKMPYAEFPLTKGTQKIGDTLFVDGVPFIECAHCGMLIKKYAYGEVKASRGKSHRELKEYKISILIRWKELEEDDFSRDEKGRLITVQGNLIPVIRLKRIPVLIQRAGCFDCWNVQYQQKQQINPGIVAFNVKDCRGQEFNPENIKKEKE